MNLRRPEPSTIVMVLSGRIARADLPGLCARVRSLLERSDARMIVCDVGGLVDPDAVAVDALARLQLTVRRLGSRMRVRRACEDLRDLLVLVGLCDVVLSLEPIGEAEEREQPRGVEEEADPGDPPA